MNTFSTNDGVQMRVSLSLEQPTFQLGCLLTPHRIPSLIPKVGREANKPQLDSHMNYEYCLTVVLMSEMIVG